MAQCIGWLVIVLTVGEMVAGAAGTALEDGNLGTVGSSRTTHSEVHGEDRVLIGVRLGGR